MRTMMAVVVLLLSGCISADSAVVKKEPSFDSFSWDYEDLWCEDRVPVAVAVANNGDAAGEVARVVGTIYNINNAKMDTETSEGGTIEVGGVLRAGFSFFAQDACGRDDYVYVHITVEVTNGPDATWTTPRFSI